MSLLDAVRKLLNSVDNSSTQDTIVDSNSYNELRKAFYIVTGEWHGEPQLIKGE